MPIRFVFAFVLFNMTSARGARVLVPLYAIALGAGPLTIGVLAGAFALFPMLLSWPAGKIADRYGPRRPVMFGAAVCGCGMLLPVFVPTLPAVFAAAALVGLGGTFYNVASQNLVGTLSNTANRTRNYSNYALVVSVANSAGPVLAGVSIDRAGYSLAFVLMAALVAIPVVMTAVWGGVLPGGRPARAEAGGGRDKLIMPGVWSVIAISSIAQSGLDVFQVYMPVYGSRLGFSATAIGVIVAMCAAGGFVSRIILPRLITWFRNEERVLAYALFLGMLSLAAVPFSTSAVALALISGALGFGLNCSQPIALTLMYARSPQGRSGEALGLRFSIDNATKLVAPVMFGAFAVAIGLSAVFWINALILAFGGALAHRGAPPGGKSG